MMQALETNLDIRTMDNSTVHNISYLNCSNCSNDNNATVYRRVPPLLAQSPPAIAAFAFGYVLIFFVALINNSLVVTVIYRTPQMRTVTNMFLANLAIADILVSLLVLPSTLLNNLFTGWIFGGFLCKAIPYVQAVVVSASVNTLAAVAVERYFAIFYPHKTVIGSRPARFIIAFIWLVPVGIQVPWAFYMEMIEMFGTNFCVLGFPSPAVEAGFFFGVVFLTCYCIPLFFISVFYSLIGIRVWQRQVSGIRGSRADRNIQRSKIRIVRMLVTVAMVFALLWLPLYSLRMRHYFGPKLKGQSKVIVMRVLIPLAQWLSSANSCVNPFIYCYFSEQFRKHMLDLLRQLKCCSKWSLFSLPNKTTTSEKIPFTAITSSGETTCTSMCDKATLANFPNDQSTLRDNESSEE